MNIQQAPLFERTVKKLTKQQKKDVDNAVIAISENPNIGESKVGDLAGVSVYKFKMDKQLVLLAYSFESETITLYLLKLGSHENFYRDLKR
ncbi:type II toxin-antitoxin system RelE/ParE family toxin [Acinetobacter sp. A3.8]|uniref:Type II toxin-antitoxin system RelE/ParE family toxin n=1 Tax=Acinetobacter sedimenti TaxID=2919922 RepID=A0A9X1WXX0_9GAMM|nr:type II toxin-antitoxin system RelE/ParE family toxin [Acinetobacter sedimenti]MCJ8147149.1 type II toxin-antitoxin system RelE/ParE family toxin [Acinetobacter sedimenti]